MIKTPKANNTILPLYLGFEFISNRPSYKHRNSIGYYVIIRIDRGDKECDGLDRDRKDRNGIDRNGIDHDRKTAMIMTTMG